MSDSGSVALGGGHREPAGGARRLGPADPDEHIDVTVVLRPKERVKLGRGARLRREQLAERFSADPSHMKAMERFAARHRLQVLARRPERRTLSLSGTVADFERTFGVDLAVYEDELGRTYRGRTGDVYVPAEMQNMVLAVLGLDDRPQARPHLRIRSEIHPSAAPRAGSSFTPSRVGWLYDFPSDGTGTGQTIALIELGGGFRQRDITTYFHQLGLTAPNVRAVSVDGGRNTPRGPNSADGEVMLDIEVAGAVAPGADIVVYFAPNTDRGFHDAITAAIHDQANQPSIISISWGGPEPAWTPQAFNAFDQAFVDAAAVGITVFCAAGDSGSSDGVRDGKAHVDFPASSPHVVGCGGTRLSASSSGITGEVVWSSNGATGGGISSFFDVPDYQQDANVPPSANPDHRVGRGVPDVAGDADPASGYLIRVDGAQLVIGGTSAVAPLWAGLTALINEQLGTQVGFLNPALYEAGPKGEAFNDITKGSNGAYDAAPGWDPCTGWGSPWGSALLSFLRDAES